MPMRDFECLSCGNRKEDVIKEKPWCYICDLPMQRVEISLPAKTRVGKYGKGGGS